jgi:diguanylate cyclase (GGDEF)-like protein
MEIDQISTQELNQMAWEARLDDWQTCLSFGQEALKKAIEESDELQMGYALRTLAFIDRNQSNLSQALSRLSQALEIAQKYEDFVLQRDILNFLAATYATMGNMQAALGYTQTALKINQELKDVGGQVSNLINLGNIFHALGRFNEAESVCLEAIEQAASIQDSRRIAEARGNLALAYLKLERFQDAVDASRQALQSAQELKLTQLATRVQVNLAEALAYLGKFAEALALLRSAEKVFVENDIFEGIVHCRLYLGLIFIRQELVSQAIASLESGLALCKTHGLKDLEAEFHQRISEAHEHNGHFEQALKHHKIFHQIEREVRQLDTERQLNAISAQRELDRARAEADLERMRRVELGHLVGQLEWQAISDPLTGLHNRRYLETQLEKSFLEAKIEAKPLTVAMLDIDSFKQVNDTYGHGVGDNVLKVMAKLAKDSLRTGDIAARYGGEEFALVIHTSLDKATRACERLRVRVETYPWDEIHPELKVTITVGVCADTNLENHEKMLNVADEKLYVGKRSGKNQVQA